MRVSPEPDVEVADGAPVFVVGCPRSGTYLLSLILSSEFGLAMPVETHFIPLFAPLLPLFGSLERRANRQRLLDCIYGFLALWTPRSERDRDAATIRRYSLLATREASSAIVDATRDYPGMVRALFTHQARCAGADGWGDKSAFFRHLSLDRATAMLPDARIVHVVRDGRDVSLSWLGIWTGPVNLAQAAATWREHVEAKCAWGARHPTRYLELRYEDLLAEPQASLRRLAEFLGRAPRHGTLAFHDSELAATLAGGAPHAKVSEPLDPLNRDKWRTRMSLADQQLFEWVAGETLARCGYARATPVARGVARIALALRALAGRLRGRLSWHELQIQSKHWLPLVLLVCHHLRLPLVRLLNRRHPVFRDD